MSKQIKYFCNMCTEERDRSEVMSYYFSSVEQKPNGQFGEFTLIADPDKCDRHLCKYCFGIIVRFSDKHKEIFKENK